MNSTAAKTQGTTSTSKCPRPVTESQKAIISYRFRSWRQYIEHAHFLSRIARLLCCCIRASLKISSRSLEAARYVRKQ
jgi:hypothetical protein